MLMLDVLLNWLVVIFIHSHSPPNNHECYSFDANPDEELQQSLLWELVVLTHCSPNYLIIHTMSLFITTVVTFCAS